jgi:probable O-glycosylation ligase (exosortase A-associated)
MSLRDLFLFGVVFGSIPIIVMRPYIGVLVWSWLAYMNPHRLTWGAAFDFRFSLIVAAALLVAVLLSRERKQMIWTPLTIAWLVFFAWTFITTQLAINQEGAGIEWSRWWKINLVSLLTLLVMQSRERLHLLVWVIALSLGFYGVKGGIFTIATGGGYMVYGPALSFIEDNNAMGLALILTVPLLRYLQLESKERWIRWGLTAAIVLCIAAILGTHSRGALLGLAGMGAYLVWKSPGRFKVLFFALLLLPVLWTFMPESWHERMGTIQAYEQDSSALGRINAWWFAFNLAKDYPIFGGGFNVFTEQLFQQYAPNPDDFHDAHSIYFEVLAEQGFVGLGLFLVLGWLALSSGRSVAKLVRGRPDLAWARNLSAMVQVAIVGYAISGAFLGLAYFDLFYHLVVIAAVTRALVVRALAQEAGAGVAPPLTSPNPFIGAPGQSRG